MLIATAGEAMTSTLWHSRSDGCAVVGNGSADLPCGLARWRHDMVARWHIALPRHTLHPVVSVRTVVCDTVRVHASTAYGAQQGPEHSIDV